MERLAAHKPQAYLRHALYKKQCNKTEPWPIASSKMNYKLLTAALFAVQQKTNDKTA